MNTNCLEGWRCPECGQCDEFKVSAVQTVTLTDEGTGPVDNADAYYDDESFCMCARCEHEGKVSDFAVNSVAQTTAGGTGA